MADNSNPPQSHPTSMRVPANPGPQGQPGPAPKPPVVPPFRPDPKLISYIEKQAKR